MILFLRALEGTFRYCACLNAIEFNLLREAEERKSPGITLCVSYCSWLFTQFIYFSPFIFFISRLQVQKLGLREVYTRYKQHIGTRVAI